MAKQYAHIEIKRIDQRPADWTNFSAWPGAGLYACDNDHGWLTMVTKDGIHILYAGLPEGGIINEHDGSPPAIGEALLLKAIAAASRAEVLK